nr:MAG TPA: hypothetical protein [Caudoviricetes sp.]
MTPIQFFNHGNKDNCLIVDFNFPDKSRWRMNRQFSSITVKDFHLDLGGGMDEARLINHVLIGERLYLYFDSPIFQMDFTTISAEQIVIDCYLNNPTQQEKQTFIDMSNAFGNQPHTENHNGGGLTEYESNRLKHQITYYYSEDSVAKLIKNRTIKYLYT